MIDELKPCPFCGGEAGYGSYSGGVFVNCTECLASTDQLSRNCNNEQDATTAWNTRTAEKPPLVNWRVGLIARPDGSVERVTPDERDKEIERLREALRGLKDYCEGSGWERSKVLKAARQALGDDE